MTAEAGIPRNWIWQSVLFPIVSLFAYFASWLSARIALFAKLQTWVNSAIVWALLDFGKTLQGRDADFSNPGFKGYEAGSTRKPSTYKWWRPKGVDPEADTPPKASGAKCAWAEDPSLEGTCPAVGASTPGARARKSPSRQKISTPERLGQAIASMSSGDAEVDERVLERLTSHLKQKRAASTAGGSRGKSPAKSPAKSPGRAARHAKSPSPARRRPRTSPTRTRSRA